MRSKVPEVTRLRGFIACVAGAVILAIRAIPSPAGAAEVKLKAKGIKLCEICHSDLQERFRKPVMHTPVKSGDCTGCHNPHASKAKHLLALPGAELCFQCHRKEQARFKQEYTHTPVRSGECVGCHDPHGSDNRFSLKKKGSALCFSCHPAEMALQKAKVVHSPFAGGDCGKCHDPHASGSRAQLLEPPTKLCRKCHDLSTPKIRKAHAQFPFEKAECGSCHNPHGSDQAGLIRSKPHKVFRACGNCHKASGDNPAELLLAGNDLCFKCHARKREELKKKVVHQAIEDGCTVCHTPHAADEKRLVRGKERTICLSCHDEVKNRISASVSTHPVKVEGGRCSICHDPHASPQPHLLPADSIEVCKKCHGKHGMFTHPIGAGVIDPRNQQVLTCLSCHGVHGTQYRFTLLENPQRALCIQCHRSDEPEKGPHKARKPPPAK